MEEDDDQEEEKKMKERESGKVSEAKKSVIVQNKIVLNEKREK